MLFANLELLNITDFKNHFPRWFLKPFKGGERKCFQTRLEIVFSSCRFSLCSSRYAVCHFVARFESQFQTSYKYLPQLHLYQEDLHRSVFVFWQQIHSSPIPLFPLTGKVGNIKRILTYFVFFRILAKIVELNKRKDSYKQHGIGLTCNLIKVINVWLWYR